MLQDVFDDLTESFESTLKGLSRELAKIRTGRANIGMLDGVMVDYYGSPVPINQVANLKVPDPRMITVQPWEGNMIGPIEKAIMQAGLGLNPSNDGTQIRVPIPALSGERRQELVKISKRAGEDHKIAIRNHRRDANDMLKELEKDSSITEDEMHKGFDKVNQLTDQYIAKVDGFLERKEAEILEV